jgi:hypothetical protein
MPAEQSVVVIFIVITSPSILTIVYLYSAVLRALTGQRPQSRIIATAQPCSHMM